MIYRAPLINFVGQHLKTIGAFTISPREHNRTVNFYNIGNCPNPCAASALPFPDVIFSESQQP